MRAWRATAAAASSGWHRRRQERRPVGGQRHVVCAHRPPTAPSTLQERGHHWAVLSSSTLRQLARRGCRLHAAGRTRDGVRRRSAARSGAWAVYSRRHLPAARCRLRPACMRLALARALTFWHNAEGGSGGSGGARDPPSVGGHGSSEASAAGAAASGDVDAGSRDGRVHGALRPTPALLVFTAPHGINLLRDGRPEHLPEDFTSYIAKAWAAQARGASVCWGGAALAWCTRNQRALPGARDPNYLTEAEADAQSNAWVRALHDLKLSLPPPPTDLEGTYAARCKPPLDMSEAEAGRARRERGRTLAPRLRSGFHGHVHGRQTARGGGSRRWRGRPAGGLATRSQTGLRTWWPRRCRQPSSAGCRRDWRRRCWRRRCWRRRCWRRMCWRRRCGRRRSRRRRAGAGGIDHGRGCAAEASRLLAICPSLDVDAVLGTAGLRLSTAGDGLRLAERSCGRILCAHLADAFVEAPACLEAVAAHTCGVRRMLIQIRSVHHMFLFIRRSERPSFIVSVL